MNRNDKRFIKCEHLIRKGFIELLRTTNYNDISINHLCSTLCISKNTFYAHYLNKDELLHTIVNEQIENVFSIQKSSQQPFDSKNIDDLRFVYIHYFEYIQNNSDLLKILFSRDNEINFSTQISHRYKKLFLELINAKHQETHICPDKILMIDYYVAGGINFIKNWLLYHQDTISIAEAQNILWNLSSETNQFINN